VLLVCWVIASVCLNVDAQQCNICFVLTCWSTMQQSWVRNEMYYDCMSFASSLCVSLLMNIMTCHVRVTLIILRNVASNDMDYEGWTMKATPHAGYTNICFTAQTQSSCQIIWRALTNRTVPARSLIGLVRQTLDAKHCHASVT